MTGRGTMGTVMAATQQGAFDYIAKPFDRDQMLSTVKRASWPGNVWQLQHMLERLTILAPDGRIDQSAVQQAIEMTGSQILGIKRKTLYRKRERMGLQ